MEKLVMCGSSPKETCVDFHNRVNMCGKFT